jgi:serine/threonine protein kinase
MSFCAPLSRRKCLQKTISHRPVAADDNMTTDRNLVREVSRMNTHPLLTETSAMVSKQSQTTSSRTPPSSRFTYSNGAKLLDRYTVQRGIGIGGFGEVYFAISDAGKEVAIKQIQRNLEIELRGVSHCLNLKHPNLVAIYDVCRDAQDRWWVVMEYVAGANLRDQLDESPSGLAPAEISRWFAGMAAGVEHLHQEGVVHRDLKPGNLFDDRGVIKVGDYGLSKYISESRQGGHTESVGTFHYMAPEIARGEYGRQIDIYALGVILFELVTGRLPFDGESSHEIIMKHMTAQPDLSGVQQPYRHVIEKALQKDPKARWQSVRQMAEALGLTSTSRQDALPVLTATVVGPANTQCAGTGHAGPSATAASSQFNGAPHAQNPRAHDAYVKTQEPVARAVSTGIQDFKTWWSGIRLNRAQRAVLITLVIFGLVINTRWLLPLLSFIGIVYVPYYIIRQMLIGSAASGASYQEAHRLALAAQAQPRPLSKKRWVQLKRIELGSKRASTQLAELSGSWIAATIAALLCGVGAGVIGMRNGAATTIDIAPFAFATTMTIAASLAILAMGKFWEAHDGDPLRRRMVMLGVGGGLGALAYSLAHFLMLDISAGLERSISETELPHALYVSSGVPRLSAYMVHFALLMSVVRWWKITDPLRRTRLSLWAVFAVAVVDWMIHQIVPIGQPFGMLTAAGTVIAVQIGAPWENPSQRDVIVARQVSTPEVASANGRLI